MLVNFAIPRNSFQTSTPQSTIRRGAPARPAIDVIEREQDTEVVAELPGLRKEDVKISFEEGILSIRGERKPAEGGPSERLLIHELRGGSFERSLRFLTEVDAARITAELENGILRVRVPKAEQAKARTITIQ